MKNILFDPTPEQARVLLAILALVLMIIISRNLISELFLKVVGRRTTINGVFTGVPWLDKSDNSENRIITVMDNFDGENKNIIVPEKLREKIMEKRTEGQVLLVSIYCKCKEEKFIAIRLERVEVVKTHK